MKCERCFRQLGENDHAEIGSGTGFYLCGKCVAPYYHEAKLGPLFMKGNTYNAHLRAQAKETQCNTEHPTSDAILN